MGSPLSTRVSVLPLGSPLSTGVSTLPLGCPLSAGVSALLWGCPLSTEVSVCSPARVPNAHWGAAAPGMTTVALTLVALLTFHPSVRGKPSRDVLPLVEAAAEAGFSSARRVQVRQTAGTREPRGGAPCQRTGHPGVVTKAVQPQRKGGMEGPRGPAREPRKHRTGSRLAGSDSLPETVLPGPLIRSHVRLRGLPAGWDEVTQVTQWPLQGPKCLSLKACSVLGAASSSGPQNAPARSRTAPVSEPPRLPQDCLLQGRHRVDTKATRCLGLHSGDLLPGPPRRGVTSTSCSLADSSEKDTVSP